jgi:mono/diheme cytochrome c family protein
MSLLHVKTVISLFFLAASIATFLSMLALMGKAERKASPKMLRTTHVVFGVIFTILLAVQAYLGAKYVAGVGDQLPLRGVLHAVLGLGLVAVLMVKLLIVQYYRKLMTYVPALGMIVFALALVVFLTSTGFYLVRQAGAEAVREEAADADPASPDIEAEVETEGDADAGGVLFDGKCSLCHFADSEESTLGPGLLGILKNDRLPSSGRPATPENILDQLREPVGTMPSFTSLTDQELADLLAYMGTL